ncbi:hypothetical protein FRC02_004594 [Tulasnella sp. 418]|nr:hypothetical protein FRC02_004594 [Tulasnella sp. 418]
MAYVPFVSSKASKPTGNMGGIGGAYRPLLSLFSTTRHIKIDSLGISGSSRLLHLLIFQYASEVVRISPNMSGERSLNCKGLLIKPPDHGLETELFPASLLHNRPSSFCQWLTCQASFIKVIFMSVPLNSEFSRNVFVFVFIIPPFFCS